MLQEYASSLGERGSVEINKEKGWVMCQNGSDVIDPKNPKFGTEAMDGYCASKDSEWTPFRAKTVMTQEISKLAKQLRQGSENPGIMDTEGPPNVPLNILFHLSALLI